MQLKHCLLKKKNLSTTIATGVVQVIKWAEWWITPQHLKMLHNDFTDMDYDTWIRCWTATNAAERNNFDSKAPVTQSLNVCLIALYKIDKSNCAKSIVATKGHSISNNRSLEKKNKNAEKHRAQRKSERLMKTSTVLTLVLLIKQITYNMPPQRGMYTDICV